MKKNLAILTAAVLFLFSLTACGTDTGSGAGGAGGTENSTTDGTDSTTGANGAADTQTQPGGASPSAYAGDGWGLDGAMDGSLLTDGTGLGTVYGTGNNNTNASANAQLRGNSRSATGTVANADGSLGLDEEADPSAPDVRYTLMLDNARVHDADGFLHDGENARHDTF